MQVLVMFGLIMAICLGIGLFIGVAWCIKTFINMGLKKKDQVHITDVVGTMALTAIVCMFIYVMWMWAGQIIGEQEYNKIEAQNKLQAIEENQDVHIETDAYTWTMKDTDTKYNFTYDHGKEMWVVTEQGS